MALHRCKHDMLSWADTTSPRSRGERFADRDFGGPARSPVSASATRRSYSGIIIIRRADIRRLARSSAVKIPLWYWEISVHSGVLLLGGRHSCRTRISRLVRSIIQRMNRRIWTRSYDLDCRRHTTAKEKLFETWSTGVVINVIVIKFGTDSFSRELFILFFLFFFLSGRQEVTRRVNVSATKRGGTREAPKMLARYIKRKVGRSGHRPGRLTTRD